MIRAVRAVVHEGLSPDAAYEMFEDLSAASPDIEVRRETQEVLQWR